MLSSPGVLLANHPVVLVDGIRSYRDVSVITEHDAFPDRFLKITSERVLWRLGRAVVPRGHRRGHQHLDLQHAVRRAEPGISRRLDGSADLP